MRTVDTIQRESKTPENRVCQQQQQQQRDLTVWRMIGRYFLCRLHRLCWNRFFRVHDGRWFLADRYRCGFTGIDGGCFKRLLGLLICL